MRGLLPLLLLASLAFAGCSGDEPSDDDQDDGGMMPADDGPNMPGMMAPMTQTVMMQNNQFSPAELTIHVGDTVTWHTMDPQRHNVVSSTPGQEFRSSDMSSLNVPNVLPDSFSRTFTVAGQVEYQCDYHLPGMVGTLTVLAANATA